MSMYNLLFGNNPMSEIILATLGLRTSDVGRFRDCFIDEDRIAVYTRNGGGNRNCWHEDGNWYASKECKHEERTEIVDETVEATSDEAAAHPEWIPLNIFCGNKRTYKTGNKVPEKQYRCLEPSSIECSCPGCTIQYRLRKHPLYITDRDDDFDSTYATIYFKFPSEFADDLKKLATGEKFDPDKRWAEKLESLK